MRFMLILWSYNKYISLMKKYTWKEVIKQNEKHIKIIGYWSLLNDNTHHSKHILKPVIFYWFKRIYNLRAVPLSPSKKWLKFFKNYLKKYGIINKKSLKKHISSNTCVLNCVKTWNSKDSTNWLCLKVKAKDLINYSIREAQYNLVETNFKYICPETWKETKTSEKAFVLTAKKTKLADKWSPFLNYHINTRKWAYKIWKYFWELFDATTYNIEWKIIKI